MISGKSTAITAQLSPGYSDVIKGVTETQIPIDAPPINFQDEKLLKSSSENTSPILALTVSRPIRPLPAPSKAQDEYRRKIQEKNEEILEKAADKGKLTILLAGRPYHADPLVQHKLSDTIAAMGINVINEDLVRGQRIHRYQRHVPHQAVGLYQPHPKNPLTG